MAVLSRVNFVGQQRVDLHDMAATESFIAADLRALVSTFLGTESVYIVRGLEVVSKNGLTVGIKVADCQILNPLDGNGSFYIGTANDTNESVDLPADQTNIFVEAVFSNTTQAPVNRGLWDPLSLTNEDAGGQEFSAAVDTQSIIQLEISVNTTGFTEGAVPLFRASTSASAITSFVDSRPLLFRLGTGGAVPDPLNQFNFSGLRDEPTPTGVGVGNAADSPWRSRDAAGIINDKGIRNQKEWMDAVMTRIAEISGLLWYQGSAPGGASTNISLQSLWFDTLGHSIQPSKNSAFKWTNQGSGLVLAGEGSVPLNGTTSQYHEGLIRWKMNNAGLEWHLGGSFATATKRNYDASGLRFASGVPTDGGNVYLQLEREVQKGSGANVNWGDEGTSAFAATEAVSGSPGDFEGIALGDYIRKQSGSFTTYFKVQRMWNGSVVIDNANASEENTIADSTITALELIDITQPNATNVTASSEPLLYFRSRYSSDDIVVDDTATAEGVIHDFQDNKFQWLGRRDGDLFFLRGYGTMQEGEEATTLDVVFAHGQKGGGQGSLVIEHAQEAVYDESLIPTSGYNLKTGSGTLVTLRRRRRDNTVDTPSSGDNSGALLSYTVDAAQAIPNMTVGQGLWVRLSDTTSAALTSGSVTNTTDDEDNTDTLTNRWEIRDAVDTPTSSFDNIDVHLLARRVDINGQACLIFADGSILTAFGQMLNTNVDISGRVRLASYGDTAVPYMAQDGSKELKDDATEFFYNETTETFGVRDFRISDNTIETVDDADITMFSTLGDRVISVGSANTTFKLLGDLVVEGDTIASNVDSVQAEDKLISLGVGNILGAQGGGIEIAETTLTSTQVDTVNTSANVTLTFGAAPTFTAGEEVEVSATEDVNGITSAQMNGKYTVITSGPVGPGQILLSGSTLEFISSGTATATGSDTTNPPRVFNAPWQIQLSDSSGNITDAADVTSYRFKVRDVATTPTITPVADYGIVPTAHSVNMVEQRIPFVNGDNAGPSDDSTIDFTDDLRWNNSTKVMIVTGDIIPGADDSHDLGASGAAWRYLYLGPGSDSGVIIGTTNLYEDGNDGATSPSNILKSDGIIEAGAYMRSGRMTQLTETTSFTGPEPLPTGTDLNIFQRDGLVYSQNSAGLQRILTNTEGNIYHEKVTGISGNGFPDTPFATSMPLDSNAILSNAAPSTTVAAASGDIDITINGHGFAGGETIRIYTTIDIDGITASQISGEYTLAVIDVNTIRISTAGSASVGGVSGFIDQVRYSALRRYIVGFNEIEVFLNGKPQTCGIDFDESGSYGNLSNVINWYKKIDATDTIEYRIDANGGQVVIKQAGGSDLQGAYDAGNTISITSGTPVTISGPSGQKLLRVLGDMDVTGLIDPTGITFDPQSVSPMDGSQFGLYTSDNVAKDLIYHIGTGTNVNITQDFLRRDGSQPMTADLNMGAFLVVASSAPTDPEHLTNKAYVDAAVNSALYKTYYDGTNNTGVTITAGSIVTLHSVAGEIVLADASSIVTSEGVIGIVVADILDGESGKVQIAGEAEVDVNQTAVFVPGRAVYVSEATAGSGTPTPPSGTTGDVVFSIGPATSTTKVVIAPEFRTINSNVYEEEIYIVASPSAYNEIAPQSPLTTISLPTDSRDGNSSQTYIVGSGKLRVHLNGEDLTETALIEVGTSGAASSVFQVDRFLDEGDELQVTIDPETTTYLLAAGGGGGSGSLQDAYNTGSVITVSSGNPVTFNGPGGEKLVVINGDLDVTGMIDPTGISFTKQSSDPTPADQHGLYFNTDGDLIWSKDDGGATSVNVGQIVENSATPKRIESQFLNFTGAGLTKGRPVRINASGNIESITITNIDNALSIAGLTSDAISHNATGLVTTHGRLENVTLTAIVGDTLYISPTGGLIGSSELTSGYPKTGEDGYVSGHTVIRVGTVAKNVDTPANKDIMVNVNILHQLP